MKKRTKGESTKSCPYSPTWLLPANRFGNNRWIVFSIRLMRLIVLYSDLEYDHWVIVESNPRIISYCEQPLRVRVKLPSGFVTTVFDMWLLFDSGEEEFREIKYREQLTQPKTKRQIDAQKMWCGLKPARHEVFDQFVIRSNPLYLHSWKFILRCLVATHKANLKSLADRVFQLLANGPRSLGQLEGSFSAGERILVRPTVFRLLHSGQATAPLETQAITSDLPVEIKR